MKIGVPCNDWRTIHIMRTRIFSRTRGAHNTVHLFTYTSLRLKYTGTSWNSSSRNVYVYIAVRTAVTVLTIIFDSKIYARTINRRDHFLVMPLRRFSASSFLIFINEGVFLLFTSRVKAHDGFVVRWRHNNSLTMKCFGMCMYACCAQGYIIISFSPDWVSARHTCT